MTHAIWLQEAMLSSEHPACVEQSRQLIMQCSIYSLRILSNNHQKMRDASFTPKDKKNPTLVEIDLIDVIRAFGQLQKDRHRADYDLSWKVVEHSWNRCYRCHYPGRGCVQ